MRSFFESSGDQELLAVQAFACLWFVVVVWLRWQLNRMTPEELDNDRAVRAIIKRIKEERNDQRLC